MSVKELNIQNLVKNLCPDGVECFELRELGQFYSGLSGKSKEDFDKGNAKYITYMNVYSNMSVNTDITSYVSVKDGEKQNLVKYGDVLFTGSSETPDECGMSSVLTENISEPLYLNSFCFGFRFNEIEKFSVEFLKHLFRGDEIRKQIYKTASGVTRFNVSKKRFSKIRIPLPPLDIQKEIAKILNEFTELEAELEAELESRKKQYEYYSNELLSFNEDIEYKELGKSLERTKGTAITAKRMNELNKGDAPIKIFAGGKTVAYVDYGDIPSKDVLTEESIVVKSRGFIGFEYIDKPFSHKNEFWSYHSTNPNISIKYVYYYLRSKEPYFQRIGQRMSKMPQLSIPDTDKYQIPIPPLSEQKRIVSILDKFDSLVNDISIGLPAELKARRKQYEYYRNKLLTFKEYGK